MAASHAIENEHAQFEALIARHAGIIFKIAASYSHRADDRDDLAQEIALQLWRAWPGYDRSRSFSTWMYRIALNAAISNLRRTSRRPAHESLSDKHDELVGTDGIDAENQQQLELIQKAMQVLSPLDRALLLLHLEGCSHRECGAILGITETNAATRLSRIKQRLKQTIGNTHH